MQVNGLTSAEIRTFSDQVAAGLYATGFENGSAAAIYMRTCPQWTMARQGIDKLNAHTVVVPPDSADAEIINSLNDGSVDTIFVMSQFYEQIKRIQPQTGIKRVICTNIKEYFPVFQKFLFTVSHEKSEGHRVTLAAEDMQLQDLLKLGAKSKLPTLG